MFNLFRRNCLYNESIEPHCAYCAHCKPENEYQGVCDYRGIVAMAGSCRRFTYDALRRKPAKPARIRGRFTDADFFFEESAPQPDNAAHSSRPDTALPHKQLLSDDLDQFSDLWEDDAPSESDKPADAQPSETPSDAESPADAEAPAQTDTDPTPPQEDDADEME